MAELIRGSQSDAIKKMEELHSDKTFGSGASLMLSLASWRTLTRQAWLLGLLERNMQIGVGTGEDKGMVFNIIFFK